MPILAKAESAFVPAPEGQFHAVCCDVVDLGQVETEWQGKKRQVHKIRVSFQLDELMDDGKPYVVSQMFTLSLSEKANLRKFLESWRGRKFSSDELRNGFDVEQLVGANALVQIVHADRGDKIYANIDSIMKAPRGAPKLEVRDYVRVKDRDQSANGNGEHAGPGLDDDESLPF